MKKFFLKYIKSKEYKTNMDEWIATIDLLFNNMLTIHEECGFYSKKVNVLFIKVKKAIIKLLYSNFDLKDKFFYFKI